jgi:hypothetical protein
VRAVRPASSLGGEVMLPFQRYFLAGVGHPLTPVGGVLASIGSFVALVGDAVTVGGHERLPLSRPGLLLGVGCTRSCRCRHGTLRCRCAT